MLIVGSVRPTGRRGEAIAAWAADRLAAVPGIETDLADLREIALPFYDETLPASHGHYEHAHTLAWSRRVAAADGFLLVNPEYNGSFTAGVKNALDFLFQEWDRKPIGLINYGAYTGGSRSAIALQPVLGTLGLVRTRPEIAIRMIADLVVDGVFEPEPMHEQTLTAMIDDLLRLATALAPLRARS